MPLMKSGSREAVGVNIKREMGTGKGRAQATAIALDVQRRANGEARRKTKRKLDDAVSGAIAKHGKHLT